MTPTLRIRHFTDPGCPFAFSAEPTRLKLRWLFGDQIEWEDRMVVLSRSPEEQAEHGLTPEKLVAGFTRLQREFGMPIRPDGRDRLQATEPACRAVVAARLHAPEAAEPLLRRLRIRGMAGAFLDDPETIAAAAADVGLDAEALAAWMEEPATREAVEEDARVARDPADEAEAMPHKLAHDELDGWRYTCPSYEITRAGENGDGDTMSIPGFQPFAAYEVAIAHLAPGLARRDTPESAADALAWADGPLASEEVAQLLEIELPEAREALAQVATETPVGADGWWRPQTG